MENYGNLRYDAELDEVEISIPNLDKWHPEARKRIFSAWARELIGMAEGTKVHENT